MPYTNRAFAEKYASYVDSAPHNALYERPAMMSMLPDVAQRHILDAGCGSGWYAEQLLARGARVTAIDLSEALVECARARLARAAHAAHAAEVRVADFAAPLNFLPNDTVDGIVSALAIHYLEDWGPTLAEFRRVLKPGGWLQFSTHHPCTEAARLNISRYFAVEPVDDYWESLGAVRFFRRPLTSIFESLSAAGLVVDRVVEPQPTEGSVRPTPSRSTGCCVHLSSFSFARSGSRDRLAGMTTIRPASSADAAAIAAIYAPFCESSPTSFETVAPTADEMAGRIATISAQWPWLVLDAGGVVTGYAYASRHRDRTAYQWAVDTAVYVADDHRRRGVGRALYTTLLALLREAGYFKACAGITVPNPASVALHEAVGFTIVGVYRGIGYKLGGWQDVAWYEAGLQAERANPSPPRQISELRDAVVWRDAIAQGMAAYVSKQQKRDL